MKTFTKNLIAPCGMNCGVCLHFLREKNKCPGCFSGRKVNQRPIKCGIKLCIRRRGEYCFNCNDFPCSESLAAIARNRIHQTSTTRFPCERLKRLDKRYREKYGMSEIENLVYIKKNGISKFLKEQSKKYISSKGIYCVHDKKYYGGEK